MQLGRYQVSTLRPPPILSIDFSVDGRFFGVATESGYEVWRTAPLGLLRRRKLPGTLAKALPLPDSPLVALQGGGKSPLYPPNKVILYNDAAGQAVAELEFSERVRGIIARRGAIFVALSRRVLGFEYGSTSRVQREGVGAVSDVKGKGKARDTSGQSGQGFWVNKIGEWETALNENGLMAVSTSPGSTLLALPGRQAGHVALIHLSPCPPLSPSTPVPTSTYRSPIILAHSHHLSSLSCSASGSHIVTTSERGTLLRVWDTARGRLERELRRGVDRAEMWGAGLEDGVLGLQAGPGHGQGGRVVAWSDKGTVHMWGYEESVKADAGKHSSSNPAPSLTNMLSRNLPLPKYFSSQPSTALYHLPRKNPHAFASAIGAAAEKARMPSMKMSQADEDGEWSERFVVGWVEVDVEVDAEAAPTGKFTSDAKSPASAAGQAGHPGQSRPREDLMGGINMGSREERRSFGSDRTATTTITGTGLGTGGTSRTPTPTMGLGRDTPVQGGYGHPGTRANRFAPGINTMLQHPSSRPSPHERSFSGSSRDTARPSRRVTVSSSGGVGVGGTRSSNAGSGKVMKKERQLVAITYGGDWYRVRIPTSTGATAMSGPGGNSGSIGGGAAGDVEEEGKKARRLELVEYRRLNVGGGGW